MNYPDFQSATDVLVTLTNNHELNGKPYSFVKLSVPDPTVTSHDPSDMRYVPEAAALYWPGENAEETLGRSELVTWDGLEYVEANEAAVATMRNRILDSCISQKEVDRSMATYQKPSDRSVHEVVTYQKTKNPAMCVDERRCIMRGLPFAVCQFSKVAGRPVNRTETTAMHLWYPTASLANFALMRLKWAI